MALIAAHTGVNSGSDSVAIGIIIALSPHLHTPPPPPSPSLMNRTVSVDLKLHVYLFTLVNSSDTVSEARCHAEVRNPAQQRHICTATLCHHLTNSSSIHGSVHAVSSPDQQQHPQVNSIHGSVHAVSSPDQQQHPRVCRYITSTQTASTASLHVDTVSECTQLHRQQVCMSILCQNVPSCIDSKSACRYCVRMYPTAPNLHVETVSECTQLHQQQVCMSILCQNVPNCTKSACRNCVKTRCTSNKSACRYCVRTCPELQKRQLVIAVLPYTCL